MISHIFATILQLLILPVTLSVKLFSNLIKPLLVVSAVLLVRYIIRHRRSTNTACNCPCILITPYIANGVKTAPIAGCLYCDRSNLLQTAAEETLSTLRQKRNNNGYWAGLGATLSFLGSVTTGPLFDILSGSSVGVAVKTGRFMCINGAVNRLKPFVADVLQRRPHVARCRCDPLSTRSSVSGFCDLTGGNFAAMMNNVSDKKTYDFDHEELFEHFHTEFETGSTFFEAASAIFDFF